MPNHIIIGDTKPRIQYTADGTQTEFPYPFPIFEASDLRVYVGDQEQKTGFTVRGAGDSQGGKLTFDQPPSARQMVTLLRIIPVQRVTDFQEGGAFRARLLNDELDRMTAQIQQIEAEATRSLQLQSSESEDRSLELPIREQRSGKLLGFDHKGYPVAEVTPEAVMQAGNQARDAKLARDQSRQARNQAQAHQTAAGVAREGAEVALRQAREVAEVARIVRATIAEARAGNENTKIMTPLRTREAIHQERRNYPFFRLTKNQFLKGTDGRGPDFWVPSREATYHLVQSVGVNVPWANRTDEEKGLLRALGKAHVQHLYKSFNIWRIEWRDFSPGGFLLTQDVTRSIQVTAGAVTKLLSGGVAGDWADGAVLNEWRITGTHYVRDNLYYRHSGVRALSAGGSLLVALPAAVAGHVPIEDGVWGPYPYIGDHQRDDWITISRERPGGGQHGDLWLQTGRQ